jgi:hypothetical protein
MASRKNELIFTKFSQAAFPEVLKIMEKDLGSCDYSLQTLFRDQQRDITRKILAATMENILGVYRQIYEASVPLLRFLNDASLPAPKPLLAAAEYVCNVDLKHMIENDEVDPEKIRQLTEGVKLMGGSLDAPTVEMSIRRCLEKKAADFHATPADMDRLRRIEDLLTVLSYFPFEINLRKVQNNIYDVLIHKYPDVRDAAADDAEKQHWVDLFESVCGKLRLQI